MKYKTSDEFVSDEMPGKDAVRTLRMAVVTKIESDGRPYIKFFGETEASEKTYKRLSSYTPTVGDTVVVGNINGSFFVLGKLV